MHSLFLNETVFLNYSLADCLFYFLNSAALTSLVSLCVLLYKTCRPLLPSRVNCWFCNRSLWVRYHDKNCFDCPYCDQYNGFTSDGDYNKELLFRKKNKVCYTSPVKKPDVELTNGLCHSCNNNQRLKVQQLASFIPMDDAKYDEEIAHFKEQLEKCYRLCEKCNLVLTQTLQTQQYNLLTQRLNGHCRVGAPTDGLRESRTKRLYFSFHILSICCINAFIALSMATVAVEMNYELSWIVASEAMKPIADNWNAWRISLVLPGIGAFLNLCLIVTSRDKIWWSRSGLCLALWGLLQAMSLSSIPPSLILISSIIGLLLHFVQDFSTGKRSFTAVTPSVPLTTVAEVVKTSINEQENQKTKSNNPIDSSLKTKPGKKPSQEEPAEETLQRMETRSQSQKKLVAEVGPKIIEKDTPKENRARLFSPPPEVYAGINGLRLSSVEPEARCNTTKPAHDLYQNLNFGPKTKLNLIKPAKFTLNNHYDTSSVKSHHESESVRNISPPSCHESLDDLAVLPQYPVYGGKCPGVPPYQVDYDFPNPNYGSHPPYLPSMPVGHTTVYTYSRPAAYPFNFSPPRFSPQFMAPYESSLSPRISEFSSASQGDQSFGRINNSQSFFSVKRIFYIASVVLNIASMIVLLSFWLKG